MKNHLLSLRESAGLRAIRPQFTPRVGVGSVTLGNTQARRACLKNGNWPAAVPLPALRWSVPYPAARDGDARNVPPRAQLKSLAAAHFRFFRQTPMKIRHTFIIVWVALAALFVAGCATDRGAQTQSIRPDASFLLTTNSVPGSTYEVRVYVIAAGDTAAKIARKFQLSLREFRAINPGLDPKRLKIGQRVRVYEQLAE